MRLEKDIMKEGINREDNGIHVVEKLKEKQEPSRRRGSIGHVGGGWKD